MKNRILTFAAITLMSINLASADNYRTLRISDLLGRTMEIFVKVENVQETFEFDTREVFNEVKRNGETQMIDITPFIKPEKEVEENLPF